MRKATGGPVGVDILEEYAASLDFALGRTWLYTTEGGFYGWPAL
jgi:hypothetical protein